MTREFKALIDGRPEASAKLKREAFAKAWNLTPRNVEAYYRGQTPVKAADLFAYVVFSSRLELIESLMDVVESDLRHPVAP